MSSYESTRQDQTGIGVWPLGLMPRLFDGALHADDHPASAEPDAPSEGLSLDEILEELHETGGEGIVLVNSQGRRILGEGVVELMAGQLGRCVVCHRFGRRRFPPR